MRTLRVAVFLPGIAALVWGVMLFSDFAFPLRPDTFFTLGWLLGGPLVHDVLIAPVVGIVGLVLTSLSPPGWKAPVMIGTVLSAILTILAIPLLWRTYGAPPPPGPHKDASTGLLVSLGAVWLAVLLAGVTGSAVKKRKNRA
ncbi:MAG: hypothetical protein QOI21_5208 [Actinomycetota bacterium]|jgi:hypothetical protein|nr:hypothetical protein [Actinomycetota bacterium]